MLPFGDFGVDECILERGDTLVADGAMVGNIHLTADYITGGIFSLDGEFVVENHGVDPDIVIDNLPHEVIAGRANELAGRGRGGCASTWPRARC